MSRQSLLTHCESAAADAELEQAQRAAKAAKAALAATASVSQAAKAAKAKAAKAEQAQAAASAQKASPSTALGRLALFFSGNGAATVAAQAALAAAPAEDLTGVYTSLKK